MGIGGANNQGSFKGGKPQSQKKSKGVRRGGGGELLGWVAIFIR